MFHQGHEFGALRSNLVCLPSSWIEGQSIDKGLTTTLAAVFSRPVGLPTILRGEFQMIVLINPV